MKGARMGMGKEKEKFVTLEEIIAEFVLEPIYMPAAPKSVKITSAYVNRAGLQVAGFLEFYNNSRIQIMGKIENKYLSTLPEEEQKNSVSNWFLLGMPALIITRGMEILPIILEMAKKYDIPVLRTSLKPSMFISELMSYLGIALAPRMTIHGVLMDIYGVGVLMTGESGIGKSETALGLLRRNHRLIADDAVEIRRLANSNRLHGFSPPLIKHFMEVRGVGVIDVNKIFGISALEDSKYIDLVIKLEEWNDEEKYNRLGSDSEFTELLGVKVPSLLIPVRQGRDIATIIEIATMNNALKIRGYSAEDELNRRFDEFHNQE